MFSSAHELTYPPGASCLHLVHINCVIRSPTKCVKLDVSCHTLYLDLPGTKRRVMTPVPHTQQVSKRHMKTCNKWASYIMSSPLHSASGFCRCDVCLIHISNSITISSHGPNVLEKANVWTDYEAQINVERNEFVKLCKNVEKVKFSERRKDCFNYLSGQKEDYRSD